MALQASHHRIEHDGEQRFIFSRLDDKGRSASSQHIYGGDGAITALRKPTIPYFAETSVSHSKRRTKCTKKTDCKRMFFFSRSKQFGRQGTRLKIIGAQIQLWREIVGSCAAFLCTGSRQNEASQSGTCCINDNATHATLHIAFWPFEINKIPRLGH